MFKNMKIKSQVIAVIALLLSIVISLQVFLYIVLQSQNKKSVSMIFNSISDNVESQLKGLKYDISEICSLLSTHSVVQNYLYSFSESERVRNIYRINEIISDYRARNQNICCLAVIKDYKTFLSSESESLYLELNNLISKYIDPENVQKVFTPSFVSGGKTYFAYFLPIFPTEIDYRSEVHSGNYVACIYELKTISYSPYSFIDDNQINMIITDENNNVLISPDVSLHNKAFDSSFIKKDYLSKSFSLSEPNWRVTIFAPFKGVMSMSDISKLFIVLMVIFNLIMLLFMIKLLNGTFIKRLMILKESITKIPSDCTDYSVSYSYGDEYKEIVTVINQILHKISVLNEEKLATLDKLYKAELLQKETQIFYLYGQMSPHFLYNSMFCIQGMALKHKADDIVNVTASLSNVFRYFSSNLNVSTIGQDIHFAVEYFKILNMRRQAPAQLKLNIDDSLNSIRCLKMIYQPILENSLKHAFSPQTSGEVLITSIEDDEYAIIEIEDNGKGIGSEILDTLTKEMEVNTINDIHRGEHVGLINVHMRLKLYYGDDCGLKITSKPDCGTKVQIKFKKHFDKNKLPFDN